MNLTGMKTRSGGWARRFGALAALLAVAALAGCSAEEDPVVAPTPTTTRRQPTTTTTAVAQDPVVAEIVGRYKQFWEVRFEANREPVNPDDTRFIQYAADQQLENVLTETRQRLDQGLAIKRPNPSVYVRRVKLLDVDGDKATLQDCVTNDGVIYRVATGEVVDDNVVTRSLVATMRLVDGTWKLAETRMVQEWKGVAGCARSSDFS